MLYEEYGNLIFDEKYKVICHQTNCKSVFNSNFGKIIFKNFPSVRYRDADYCKHNNILGTILPVRISPERICINLYGQYDPGKNTDYKALESAFNETAEFLKKIPNDWPVGIPYRIGCGLSGGGWNKIKPIIESFAWKIKQDVYIVRLEKKEE